MIKKLFKQFSLSGNLHSLAGNISFAISGLCTFLILVRILDKALFGQWVLFVTMVSLLDMLRLGLTGTAAVRLMARSGKKNSRSVGASSYVLSLLATITISILFLGTYAFLNNKMSAESYYLPVLLFYPALAIANLPLNQAITIAQGNLNFKRIMILRIINGTLTLLCLALYALSFEPTIQGLIISYLSANLITSLITLLAGWDKMKHVFRASKTIMIGILQFGKYSTASYVGSSLLRSSDTIILSIAPFLGAEAIAVYAIPLKFVEAVEIPLRSFSATAFPRLSKALKTGQSYFGQMLFSYIAWSTLILFPVVFLLLAFPFFFLQLVGGAEYAEFLSVQTNILYLICLYILLLPLDRYSGVALFALDKPKYNFYKILIMLIANVIFDIIAVFIFKSLVLVALATLVFTVIGISTGWYMLFRETKTTIRQLPNLFTSKKRDLLCLLKGVIPVSPANKKRTVVSAQITLEQLANSKDSNTHYDVKNKALNKVNQVSL